MQNGDLKKPEESPKQLTDGRPSKYGRRKQRFFLELFAGAGELTAQVFHQGVPSAPPVDIASGLDLNDRGVRARIVGCVRKGYVLMVWLAPPCGSYTIARRGVKNFEAAIAKYQGSASLILFAAEIMRACVDSSTPFCHGESPHL